MLTGFSRVVVALELCLMALAVPGLMITTLYAGVVPARLLVIGVFALAAWACAYGEGLSYVRGNADSLSHNWGFERIAPLLGPIPSAIMAALILLQRSNHVDPTSGVFFVACLVWIPAVHLELVRYASGRSNYRMQRSREP